MWIWRNSLWGGGRGGGRNMRDNVKKKLESNNVNLKKFFVGKGVGGGGEKHEGQCQEEVGIQQCEFEEILWGEGWAGKKKTEVYGPKTQNME